MIKATIKVNLNKNSYPIFLGENHIDIAYEIISNLGEFSKIIIITEGPCSEKMDRGGGALFPQ